MSFSHTENAHNYGIINSTNGKCHTLCRRDARYLCGSNHREKLTFNSTMYRAGNILQRSARSGSTRVLYARFLSMIKKPPPPPQFFDYETIVKRVRPCNEIINAVENALVQLSNNNKDTPLPMRIWHKAGGEDGRGYSNVMGGYVEGADTWTVKLANTSFLPGIHKSMPSTTGMTIVSSAVDGSPLGVFQDNRYLTNLRTGAAGAIAVKYLTGKSYYHHVAFIGTGEIAYAMAESAHWVNRFEQGYAYGLDKAETQHFANEIHNKLGYRIRVCETAEEAVRNAEVVFTQTTSTSPVLEESWFKAHATIIASGADQPGKNELPVSLLQHCKLVTDLTRQCAKNGELRTAIEQGGLSEESVYAELGEIIRGAKPGRQPEDELIVVDLTGTGAQDAAVCQYAWETLRKKD